MSSPRRKVCTVCGKRKALSKFYRRASSSDGVRSACKECSKTQQHAYTRTHLGQLVQSKKDRRARMRVWFQKLKSRAACKACGEDDPRCLDFHHRDPTEKEFKLADAIRQGWSKKKIVEEIAKCDVLCANCHRKHHAEP